MRCRGVPRRRRGLARHYGCRPETISTRAHRSGCSRPGPVARGSAHSPRCVDLPVSSRGGPFDRPSIRRAGPVPPALIAGRTGYWKSLAYRDRSSSCVERGREIVLCSAVPIASPVRRRARSTRSDPGRPSRWDRRWCWVRRQMCSHNRRTSWCCLEFGVYLETDHHLPSVAQVTVSRSRSRDPRAANSCASLRPGRGVARRSAGGFTGPKGTEIAGSPTGCGM